MEGINGLLMTSNTQHRCLRLMLVFVICYSVKVVRFFCPCDCRSKITGKAADNTCEILRNAEPQYKEQFVRLCLCC